MARYDYKCKYCGIETEIEHGMNETPEVKCTSCKNTMQKMIAKIPT